MINKRGVHLETVNGGVLIRHAADAAEIPWITGSPWSLEKCCDDRGPCIRPSWGSAYWHAVYRARRTRFRQAVRRTVGGWLVITSSCQGAP